MKWKRIIGWALAGIVMLLLVAAIGGYVYLKSSSFQQFALHKLVEQADSATGGRTEIGWIDFSLSTLTAHLYNITVRGTEGPEQPPLLHADKLTVRIKILSALRRQVALSELLIEHPVVHLQVSRAGKNNLPPAPPSRGSHTSVFDLAVEHVQLTNGEINYNDRKTPLEADLYDLATDIHFAPLAKRYDGELSYKNGHLRYAQYTPLPHNLNLRFSALPERFRLESASLNLGSSAVTLQAEVSNYSNPIADGIYQIKIHTQDFARMSADTAPAGDVLLNGKLHYQAVQNQSLLRNVSTNGQLASEALTATASGSRVELRRLQGTYQLAGGRLQVNHLGMESLGGGTTADVDVKNLDATPESQVRAALHNISLRAMQQTLRRQELKSTVLSGRLNGTVDAGWKGSISNIRAHSYLTVQGIASSSSSPSRSEVPGDGTIHATYDGARQTVVLRETSMRIPSATLTAQGEISDHSSLMIRLAATDLHQLAALASSFSQTLAAPPAISGFATLHAVVHGSMNKPMIAGQLNAQNLQVEGSEWTSAKLEMRADPSEFSVQSGSLVNAHGGQATFSGSVALRNWSYQPANAIKASLNVQQLRMSDVQRLANRHYPVSGDLSANMTLEGSQLNPVGSGTAQITNARAYDEPIQNLVLRFQASNGSIVPGLYSTAPAGTVDANLSYTPKTKTYKVRIDAPSVVLQKLRIVQAKNLPLTGAVSASVNGEGTLDNPQLTAVVQLPQLQVRQSSIFGLKAEVHVAEHSADLILDAK